MNYEIQEFISECYDDPCHCHSLNGVLSDEDQAKIRARVDELLKLIKKQDSNTEYSN